MVRPPTKTHVVHSSLCLSALYLFLPNVRTVGSRRTSLSRFQMCFATIPLLASFACISAKRSGCRREAHELVTFLRDVLQPSSCLSALHVFLRNVRAVGSSRTSLSRFSTMSCNHPSACQFCTYFCQTSGSICHAPCTATDSQPRVVPGSAARSCATCLGQLVLPIDPAHIRSILA